MVVATTRIVAAEEIMIAEANANRGDSAEMLEPGFEAGAFGGCVESVLVVHEVAGDDNEARFVLFGAAKDGF